MNHSHTEKLNQLLKRGKNLAGISAGKSIL